VAYVRKNRVDNGVYYQVVEGYREGGKVKQRVLAYLGTHNTVDKALEKLPRDIELQRTIMPNYPVKAWPGMQRRISSMEKRLEKIRDLRERDIA
jgi:hypothetical protein